MALTAAEAKSGKYSYYVCHSLLKRGSGTCETPRLNARSFEKLIIGQILDNLLTESNIRELVKLETIEADLEEVKRRLGRIWQFVETTDIETADAADRIKEHRERQAQLETTAQEARAILADRQVMLDDADTIAAFARDMSDFLKTSEMTETRAFVRSFVREVLVRPGKATILYTIPMPKDSPIGGADAAEFALNGGVMNTVHSGGPSALFATGTGSTLSLVSRCARFIPNYCSIYQLQALPTVMLTA